MTAAHIKFFVEEPSMEAFLRAALPRMLQPPASYNVFDFGSKNQLLKRLSARLRGYADLPADSRIIVLADRDSDDCRALKAKLDAAAGPLRRKSAGATPWQVASRVVVEELEAWYFGDWEAVRLAYPKVSATIPAKTKFRDPDAIAGGTWEQFEATLRKHGYFAGGLRKVEAATAVGTHFDPARCQSRSFRAFHTALAEATA